MDVVLFRSEAQFRLLGELFTNPAVEMTVGELAERADVSQPTVSREVARLADAGLAQRRRQGNRTLVSANTDTVISDDLRSLLAKLYGPPITIRHALRPVGGIEEAFIFGSWAARWHGEPGPAPRDIDLLVIGDPSATAVWEAAAELSREISMDVNPIIRSRDSWDADDSPFAQEVRRGPTIDVTPDAVDADAVSAA